MQFTTHDHGKLTPINYIHDVFQFYVFKQPWRRVPVTVHDFAAAETVYS